MGVDEPGKRELSPSVEDDITLLGLDLLFRDLYEGLPFEAGEDR